MTGLIFASPEWIARIKDLLAELVAEADLGDARFSLSETFTDVPPDGATTFWAAAIADGGVTFRDAPDPDADFALVADQAAALPGARLIYDGATQEMLDAAAANREAMLAAGRMTVSGSVAGASRPILKLLRRLHDTMARETQ